MLDDDQIEAIRVQTGGKVGVILFGGHQLVFRRPSRDVTREYRRKMDSPAEKPDGLDQLAQATIVAFDGETNGERARMLFLGFLTEFPMFTSSAKALQAFNLLTGLVEEEEYTALGKGVSIRSSPPKPTPKGSPNGSDAQSRVPS